MVGFYANNAQRYCDIVEASFAEDAEVIAKQMAAAEGGDLMVCGVFEGRHAAADTAYATFIDPQIRTPRAWEYPDSSPGF